MNEPPHSSPPRLEQQALLEQAVALQREGRLDEAARLYREILTVTPNHFDAMQLLGVTAMQQGDFLAAQRLLQSALDINPLDTSVMANLGTSHMRVGQFDVALRLFESALELQPESSVWNANIGTLLHNMRQYADAIPPLRKAHSLDPNSYAVCMLLGACLIGTGQTDDALTLFEAATRADSENPEGWEQIALACNALGQHQKALESARKASILNPASSVALGALGNAQLELGSFSEAVESYARAVSIAPTSADLLAAYGSSLVSDARFDEAVAQFSRALELDASRLNVRWAMMLAHLKPVYKSELDAVMSRAAFVNGLTDVEKWYENNHDVSEPFRAVGMLQPFYIAYQPVNNSELLRRYGSLCASWMSTLAVWRDAVVDGFDASTGAQSNAKVRIGIVSSHIHQHSVWTAITRGWVYNIDREKFEIHLFKLDAWSDVETDRARKVFPYFDDHPKDLNGWVRCVLDRNLDVLIYPEIGMNALTLQLASLRLAPVQAAAWGHPETTGLPTIDLYLSADGFESADAAANYVEDLVRLPNLGVYVEPLAPDIADPGLGSLNLSGGDALLLCPGAPFKYAPEYDRVWVQIAKQLRRRGFMWRNGARLVFFRSRSPAMNRVFEHRLRTAFEESGVDFDGHVSIIPALERSRFFGLMRHSALMLDTIGFSGFNTALQAIECALPVLAFEGQFMRGRLASAINNRLDLPELVARTTESFIEKALELASSPSLRQRLRAKIIDRREAIFHDMAPVKALEHRLLEAVTAVRSNHAHSQRKS